MFPVSSYKLRVECMLIREEFSTNLDFVKPAIDSIIMAAEGTYVRHI